MSNKCEHIDLWQHVFDGRVYLYDRCSYCGIIKYGTAECMSKRIKKPSKEAVSCAATFLELEVEELNRKINNCLCSLWTLNTQAKANKLSEVSEWLKELYIEGRVK